MDQTLHQCGDHHPTASWPERQRHQEAKFLVLLVKNKGAPILVPVNK